MKRQRFSTEQIVAVLKQAALARRLKELIGQDEYPATSIYDDVRFERHVRSHLRRLVKMTKANEGFEKTLHHQ